MKQNDFAPIVGAGLMHSARPDDLANLIELLPAAVYTIDELGRIEHYNKAAVELWGRVPDRADEKWCGSWRLYHVDGRPMPHDECPMARAFQTGMPMHGEEAVAERPDGSRITFIAYPTPRFDTCGNVAGAINMLVDITERKTAEMDLQRRIGQLHKVSELGLLAVRTRDLQQIFDAAVLAVAEGLGVELAKVLEILPQRDALLLRAGVGWQDGLVGSGTVGADLNSQAGYTLSIDEPVIVDDLSTETRFSGPPLLLDHGVVSGLSTIIGSEEGRPFGVLGAHTASRRRFTDDDVHFLQSVANVLAASVAADRARDRQHTLQREIVHRLRNTLSIVQSMARQSARGASSVEDFIAGYEGRLAALAAAHDLLTEEDWHSVRLEDVVRRVLSREERGRIDIVTTHAELSASGGQAVALLLNELLTNALKYGALSNAEGHVSLRVTRVEDAFRLTWSEMGGPPVQPPTRKGFGSTLLKSIVERQCSGLLTIDWRPEGIQVTLDLPLSAVSAGRC